MDSVKQHLLFIGAVWPEPNSSAGGIRMMHLLHLFLSRNWRITFACVAAEGEFSSDLLALGIEKAEIELNSDSFDVFVTNLNPNVVLFDRFMMEEQFGWRVAQACPNAMRIIETIDLHCLRLSRQQVLKTGGDLNSLLLNSEIAKRELAAIYRSDLSLIISDAELMLLKTVFKMDDHLLFHFPYYVPALSENDIQVMPSFEEREHFVTIGNFKHEPNWDSVRYLKEVVWPLIRQKMPTAILHVYGSYASPKVNQLHQPKEGFFIMGRAEDAEEVVRKARVCLAPLRFGAGIKGKLSQAMRCGTPSVTTAIGAEGMHGNLPWNGIIADAAETFATAAVHLYSDKTQWQKAQTQGFDLIALRFSNKVDEQLLIDKITEIQQNLMAHRENNFIGSMLQHHTLQSTKFMSKWIAEKNKA